MTCVPRRKKRTVLEQWLSTSGTTEKERSFMRVGLGLYNWVTKYLSLLVGWKVLTLTQQNISAIDK